MTRHLILILALCICTPALAQSGDARLVDWEFLEQVEFKDKYYPEYDAWYLYPEFSEEVKALENHAVIIKGYIIPLDVEDGLYALSANPFSSCFFCGAAGPESVMSLKFKNDPPRYETDDVVTFTGVLQLNDSNVDDFNYILNNATAVD
ncbi:MAG: DUF3299 domain-containing protein [Owenweeksia sp.]|nr:DUF3299 domain-containing protein [Owenweeksia sp.]